MLDKPLVADLVTLTFIVLPAIDFDNQSALAADEVHSVRADWLLSNELGPVNRSRAQPIPKAKLGGR